MNQKRAEYLKRYRIKNRKKILDQSRQYYNEHKDAVAARHEQYNLDHQEAVNAWQKQYDSQHKERRAANDKIRRTNKKEELIMKKKLYKANNKEKVARQIRQAALKKNYGITLEIYNDMFDYQNGKCAICGRHQSELRGSFRVDHDHGTGKIRGLLCHSCNVALGLMKDNTRILFNAIEYLTKTK